MVAVGAFRGRFTRMDHALEDDLGGSRDLQVIATALHQLGAVTPQQAGEGVLGERVRHRGHGAEDGGRVGPQGHGDRERLARVLFAPLAVIQRAATVAQPAHDHLVAPNHLLPIDAQVLPVLVRSAGHRQAPGDQWRHVARPAMLDRQLRKVDIVALDHHLLAHRVLDYLRRHRHDLLEDRQLGPGILQALGRLGLLEEGQQLADLAQFIGGFGAHAHGHPLGGAEQVAQHRDVETRGFFEQQRRALGTQGAVADFGHFQDRRDGNLDALEFTALFQATNEVAQIAILHARASCWPYRSGCRV